MSRFICALLAMAWVAVPAAALGVVAAPKKASTDEKPGSEAVSNHVVVDSQGQIEKPAGASIVRNQKGHPGVVNALESVVTEKPNDQAKVATKSSYRSRHQAHKKNQKAQAVRKRAPSEPSQLCKALQKVMTEKKCDQRGVELVHEVTSGLITLKKWPLGKGALSGCYLPKLLTEAKVKAKHRRKCTVAFLTGTKSAEDFWARLPAGGISVVQLPNARSGAVTRNEAEAEDVEGFIWQTMYQVESTLYFPNFQKLKHKELPELQDIDFGFADLQFATFLPGHALLQKADYKSDVQSANGTFWKLANEFGTDKIDHSHNYSLLYHRHLDGGAFNEKGSMMLEIGLGCILERGNAARAGASAKIWPRLLPNAAVHFIEIDGECAAHWEAQRAEAGVAKVHVGPQGDAKVLAGVINDASFAKPGGFVSVVDDGSHLPVDIETSFRSLFPHLKSGGLYFVEDIPFAAWQGYWNYRVGAPDNEELMIRTKTDRSSANPIALAAIVAAAVTGVAEIPAERNLEEFTAPTRGPDTSFFGPVSDAVNSLIATAKEPFVQKTWPVTQAVPSALHPKEWRKEILSSVAGLVDFVECSPGICVFRRK